MRTQDMKTHCYGTSLRVQDAMLRQGRGNYSEVGGGRASSSSNFAKSTTSTQKKESQGIIAESKLKVIIAERLFAIGTRRFMMAVAKLTEILL